MSGGAANGIVDALAKRFKQETGYDIDGIFGAVGKMKERLLSGVPTDVVILTHAIIDELTSRDEVIAGTAADLGVVLTSVAVRKGDAVPEIADADQLRTSLLASDSIYFPDPQLATAGIHFNKILNALGIDDEMASRLRPFPNGATAMREMAASNDSKPIGCTQVTEILSTSGVTLVGALPKEFELATIYTAAVTTRSQSTDTARALVELLSSASTANERSHCGFGY